MLLFTVHTNPFYTTILHVHINIVMHTAIARSILLVMTIHAASKVHVLKV